MATSDSLSFCFLFQSGGVGTGGEKRGLFLGPKLKTESHHFAQRTLKISQEKHTLYVIEIQQIPNNEGNSTER